MEIVIAVKTAADIMTVKPVVIQASLTVREVVHLFLENNYSSAPVVANTGEILGLADEFSLIKAELIQHLEELGRDKIVHHTEFLVPAHIVLETMPLTDVIREMVRAPTHRLIVTNAARKIVGIISPKDVLRYVSGERQRAMDMRVELKRAHSELNKALKELEKTKTRLDIYKDIVMENPTMIHSVDESGKIIMANKKMHECLGYRNNELLKKTIYDLYADAVHKEAAAGLKKIIEEGHHQNTFTTMVKKNGEKIRVDIASSAIHDHDGKFIGTISVSRIVDSDLLLRALDGVLGRGTTSKDAFDALKKISESE